MLEQRASAVSWAPRAKQCTARALSRRDLAFPPPFPRYGQLLGEGGAKIAKFVAPGGGQAALSGVSQLARRSLACASCLRRSRISSQPTERAKRVIVAGLTPALAASSSIEALAVKLKIFRINAATRDS
jgi:hypothetical protein